ncbi:MAG: Bug family tripartite tricarboxylate transporter substrate binding protein [Burkholderiales bacterium]
MTEAFHSRLTLHDSRVLLCVAALLTAPVAAQQFPVKPVRVLTGQAPGGATDLFARLFAQKLNEAWKQPVVVESRPGAAGAIAAELTAKAAPDGYTLLLSTAGQVVINPHLTRLSYDPLKDLAPVVYLTGSSLLLVTHPSVPVKSVTDLVALARANPGRLNHGSGGSGSPAHLAMELFKHLTGTKMTHIPFKGVGPAVTALIAGEIDLSFASVASTQAFVKAGRLRPLAISTPKRSSALPEIPTVAEAGVPGYEVTTWYGFFGPAAMPAEVVNRIHADVSRLLGQPDVRDRLLAEGGEPGSLTVEQFVAFTRSEHAKWGKVIRAAGIKAE